MTSRTSALLAWLVGFVAYPVAVLAEPAVPLNAAWETYRHAVRALPPDDIVAAAKTLPEAAQQAETLQTPELSLVMIRDAKLLHARGETGAAIQIARIASSLSPDLVAPHAWLAQTWLSGPDPDVLASLREWVAAGKASLWDFWSVLYRIDRFIAAALISVASAAVVTIAFFIIRTIPLLGHLIVEWSGHRVFRPSGWLTAAGIILLPLVAVRWGGWMVLAPGVVVWWFLSTRERLTLSVLAGLGVAASFLIPYVVPVVTVDHSAEYRLMVDVAGGRDGASLLDAATIVESPQGAAARGTALARTGRVEEAETLYQEALVRWPGDIRLLTGYGNVLFRRHEYHNAVVHYERALQIDPNSVPVLYNLSQAYRADLRFEEGEATYQKARAIDAGVLDRYAERSRRGDALLVVDYPTVRRDLLVDAFEPRPLPPLVQDAIVRVSRHMAPLATLGVLALFAGCWAVGRWFPNQPSSPCLGCGAAVCRHCQRYFLDLKLCPSCWKTHAKGAKFSAQTTLPQVLRRWEVRRRIAALLSLAPGVGHLSLGRPLGGLLFALLGWGLLWLGILREVSWTTTGLRMFPFPWYATWTPIALGLAVLAGVGMRQLLKMEWSTADPALPREPK
jgi:tetratricopeptide (TPR) repeat protein